MAGRRWGQLGGRPEMQSKARTVLAAMGVGAEALRRDWSGN